MRFLTADQVISIHESVILPNELQGMAHNKSIEAVLGRIENRLAYGLIGDAFDLAASYACYIAVGHCFHDANKRTAHTSMQFVLALNGISIQYDVQGLIEEDELANYLRSSTTVLAN
ncbi:MAG: type II toxin-antitoxin system death-on-curing family toxin [Planctomycetota bacterium]|jgi:death-on-curing protein